MKKFLFFVALVVTLWALPLVSFTQSTVPIRGDTVRVYKQGDSSYLKVDSFLVVTKQAVIGYPYLPLSTSTLLELNSTSRGFKPSRMTAAQRIAIGSPGAANFVWDSDSLRYMGHNGTTWRGVAWTNEVGGGIPSLAQVTNVGNTTPNAIHVIPSYLSNYSTALTFAGNGTTAYGSIIFRENSTGTGNIVTLKPVPALSADIILNIPDAPDGDTLLTRAHARALGYQAPTAGANWSGVLSFTQAISISQNISSTSNVTTGASPLTLTMPTISGNSNRVVFIKNGGSADVTVQRAGSDQLWTTAAVNSIVLEPGESVSIQQVGSYWYVFFEPSAGGSESTTASNVGGGIEVFKQLTGSDLEFRTLIAGDGIGIVQNTNDISISSTLGIDNNETWYKYRADLNGGTGQAFMYSSPSGVGASIQTLATPPYAGWPVNQQWQTGTTATGMSYGHLGNTGVVAGIAFDATVRFNYAFDFAVEDLSDGTETYALQFGFADHTTEASIADGVWFWYTHSENSGQIACKTRKTSGGTTTTASGVTLAADTRYLCEISVFDGHAYFYINKVLVADITTNIPNGTSEATSIVNLIKKSAGTTTRKMYVREIAYGDMNE